MAWSSAGTTSNVYQHVIMADRASMFTCDPDCVLSTDHWVLPVDFLADWRCRIRRSGAAGCLLSSSGASTACSELYFLKTKWATAVGLPHPQWSTGAVTNSWNVLNPVSYLQAELPMDRPRRHTWSLRWHCSAVVAGSRLCAALREISREYF